MTGKTILYGITRKADEAREGRAVQVYCDCDADAGLIKTKTVVVTGFGRQGEHQATWIGNGR
jgi:hypothetical protein